MIVLVITFFGLISALLSLWLIPLFIKLNKNEAEIRAKEDEIDAVEPDVNGRTAGFVIEKQRLAQVAKAKEPLLRELERLKQERQFIVDKLPFFKN